MQLTQKEQSLLKDLKDQEKICVEKYTKYASQALDPQLKDLFTQIANVEQQHLNTLTQIDEGSSAPSQSGPAQEIRSSFTENYGLGQTPDKDADCYLCSDLLSTEKHASALYDTSIFEFAQQPLRNTLNHIQKEEQGHGKALYDYMAKNNMYS